MFKMFTDFKVLYAGRNDPENMRPLAQLYWRMLLAIAALIFIGIILYGLWEFLGVQNNLSADINVPITKSTSFDRSKLRSTLNAVEARQSALDAMTEVTVPDPSK